MSADSDLDIKVKKSTERISENMHIVANEPSLAFYRLQEHVRKALNPMVDRKMEVQKLHTELVGRIYDMEYAISAVKSIEEMEKTYKSIQDNLKSCIFLRQQLKYEESRKKKPETNSMYKRLSAHITIDLPEITSDMADVMRETANRVEHIISKSTHTNSNNQ
ncbi:BLOC-1-related complex subunit 8 homolog [Atheta coriaria]|uniref:BLOC-1-related complex subunit 8 homolog n=1 Tax=Dalotia coriaria TaxID=877792 RepID=UPI0031F464E7